MMYLSTSLEPGPHLRTVLTHEYMHAVVFSGKCRQMEGVGPVVLEEEGWLDEALAHLAEDQQAFLGRTSTTASAPSCRSPNATSSWW